MINVSADLVIPEHELTFSFARSSGKGGQNVNKTSTKALLKWVPASSSLQRDVKERFLKKYAAKLNAFGELSIHSDRHRSQPMNIEDCREKLKEMILSVAVPPKPRKKTKPSKSQKRKRLESKRIHSDKKANRRASY